MESIETGDQTETAPRGKSRRSFWIELPILLLAALAVAVLIKTFLVQPFYIPSGSMVPTIEIDDRVMVSKLSYRFGEIERSDIVVFRNPYAGERDESLPEAVIRHVLEALGVRTEATDDLIKRVIALEGDVLEIRDNTVFVNGEPVDEPYLAPGSVMPDFEVGPIPAGHIFVMGDNRNQSSDSRVFGPVPVEDVVGEAVFRIWPLGRLGGL